jgi:hypothetical protein
MLGKVMTPYIGSQTASLTTLLVRFPNALMLMSIWFRISHESGSLNAPLKKVIGGLTHTVGPNFMCK